MMSINTPHKMNQQHRRQHRMPCLFTALHTTIPNTPLHCHLTGCNFPSPHMQSPLHCSLPRPICHQHTYPILSCTVSFPDLICHLEPIPCPCLLCAYHSITLTALCSQCFAHHTSPIRLALPPPQIWSDILNPDPTCLLHGSNFLSPHASNTPAHCHLPRLHPPP